MSEVLTLNMTRKNDGETYPASLVVEEGGDQKWLYLRFMTNPDGKNSSFFRSGIYPRHFTILARMMMEADPEAAIRAFGKAMENAQIQRRNDEPGSEVAA